MDGLGPAGEQIVETFQPGLGKLADLGVVDEDALHDARLDLRLVAAQLALGRAVLEPCDQQRARTFEFHDVIPVAGAGGFEHVLARLLDGFVVVQQGGFHGVSRCG